MKVGIIGAGTMGSGIAQAFAQTEGYDFLIQNKNVQKADGSQGVPPVKVPSALHQCAAAPSHKCLAACAENHRCPGLPG